MYQVYCHAGTTDILSACMFMWVYQLAYTCTHTRACFLVPCNCIQSFVVAVWIVKQAGNSTFDCFFFSVGETTYKTRCWYKVMMPHASKICPICIWWMACLLLSPHWSTTWFFITCGTRNIYCVDCHTQAPCIPWSSTNLKTFTTECSSHHQDGSKKVWTNI